MNSAYGVETRAEIDKLVQFNNLSEGKDAQSDINIVCLLLWSFPSFDLSDDWAVETGVTYTQLSSETRSGTEKTIMVGKRNCIMWVFL